MPRCIYIADVGYYIIALSNLCMYNYITCLLIYRGRSAEYYNKCYGPYLASTVGRVRDILNSGCGAHETSV